MKRHKRIIAWNDTMANGIGFELVHEMYSGYGDCIYGTTYHYSNPKKAGAGMVFWVKEGNKKGMAIATTWGMTYPRRSSRKRKSTAIKERIMLWLNEEGERLVKSAMTKALL